MPLQWYDMLINVFRTLKRIKVTRLRNCYHEGMRLKIDIIKRDWFSISFTLMSILVLFFFILSYQYAFNYQILFNEGYKLLFISGVVLIMQLLHCLFKRQKSVVDLLLNAFLFGFLLFSSQNPNQEFLFIVLFGCVWFIASRNLRLKYFHYISFTLMIFFLYNTLTCFFSILMQEDFQGIINNSGITAIYSAIHIPALFFLLKKLQVNPRFLKVVEVPRMLSLLIILTLIVMVFAIILKSQSRAALIVYCMLMVIHVIKACSFRLKYKMVLIAGCSLLVIPLFYVFTQSVQKQTSLDGRLLMSKIALSHVTDNFWLGTGLGRFTWYYPQWQAEYFKSASDHEKYFLVKGVGESYNILNEHLQLALSVGFIGTIAIACGFWFFFRTRSSKYPDLLFLYKCITTGILIAGCMSYPFHVNIIVFILITCFSFAWKVNEREFFYIKYFQDRSFVRILVSFVSVLIIGATIFVTITCGQKICAVAVWHESKYNYSPFLIQKSVYSKLCPYLKADGKYLIDYGSFFLQNRRESTIRDLDITISALEEARTKFISKEQMEVLAYAYWIKKDYKNAIASFEWLNSFLPYLFEPKLALMKIHIELHNFDYAKDLGIIIVRMSPKVPSYEVAKIKMEAENLLVKYKLNSQ
jgi:O-antigen ligase